MTTCVLLYWDGLTLKICDTIHIPFISLVQCNKIEWSINGSNIPKETQLQVSESCSIFKISFYSKCPLKMSIISNNSIMDFMNVYILYLVKCSHLKTLMRQFHHLKTISCLQISQIYNFYNFNQWYWSSHHNNEICDMMIYFSIYTS